MTYCLTGLMGLPLTMPTLVPLILCHYEDTAVLVPLQTTAPSMSSKAPHCLPTPVFLEDLFVEDVITSMGLSLPFHAVIASKASVETALRLFGTSTTANPSVAPATVDVCWNQVRHVNLSPTLIPKKRRTHTVGATLLTYPVLPFPVAAPAAPHPPLYRARLPAPMEGCAGILSGGSHQALLSRAQAPTAKMELLKLETTFLCISQI